MNYVLIKNGNTIQVQKSEHIEDGWIIYNNNNGEWDVYEIPTGGGEEQYLNSYDLLDDAIDYAEALT